MRVHLMLSLILLAGRCFAAETRDCGKISSGPQPYQYCIVETVGSLNPDVLYTFHGAGGDGTPVWWTSGAITSAIRENLVQESVSLPRVIEISFGPLWFLVPKNMHFRSGLLPYFSESIMPTLEAKLHRPVRKRHILGHSMGGLNAAIVGLTYPERFASITMLAPALVGVSPYASPAEIEAYARERGLTDATMQNLLGIIGGVETNDREWRDFYPTFLLARRGRLFVPAFLISTGRKDTRFFEESRRFADQLRSAGDSIIWAPHSGDHTDVDAKTVARFLAAQFSH